MLGKNIMALTALALLGFLCTSLTAQTFTSTSAVTIPAGAPATTSGQASPYPSTVTVSGVAGVVTDVNIILTGLSHTWPSDLDMLLVGPTGVNIAILSDAGDGTDVVNINITIDDAAGSTIPVPMAGGTWRPTDVTTGDAYDAPAPAPSANTQLSVYNGLNPNGTWSLYIMDDASADVGSMTSWSVVITATIPTPSITSLTPATGSTLGGTSVVIAGTNFTGTTAVAFGATAATSYTVNSATQITAIAPAGAAGVVDVAVTNGAGTSPNTAADNYTYAVIAPTITALNPTSGGTAGGNSVVITGTAFTGATAVAFGATPATSFTVDSAVQITATAPAHAAGVVDVTVTTPSGASANTGADDYTYIALPEINIMRGATPVADNATSDPLGTVMFGVAQTVTYTIQNTGSAALNLTGAPVVQIVLGANVTSASVTTPPASTTVAASGSVTFTITYTVTAIGVFDFDVSILNNDTDEATYNWNADGTGAALPEMGLTRTAAIADGGTDALGNGLAGTAIVLTYTIANTGNAALNITLPLGISGLTNCTATVTTPPAATVAIAGTTTVVITVTPTTVGPYSCAIAITNDDPDENPYNWTISGTGTTLGVGGGGGGGGGGCSTDNSNNSLLLLAGVVATLGLALRLRRERA